MHIAKAVIWHIKKLRLMKNIILATLVIFLVGCTTPQTYLNKAVDVLEGNSINRNSIDWVKFRNEVLEKGKEAESIKDTYPAIEYALGLLGDHHSFLMTPEQCKTFTDQKVSLPEISAELINDRIGYIKIPGFW